LLDGQWLDVTHDPRIAGWNLTESGGVHS
jgi:hypothetical protein